MSAVEQHRNKQGHRQGDRQGDRQAHAAQPSGLPDDLTDDLPDDLPDDISAARDAWYEVNGEYLECAMTWLRLLLERHIDELSTPEELPARGFLHRRTGRASGRHPAPADEEAIATAAQEMADAAEREPFPAMTVLARRLGLSPFERDVLLLVAALEIDTRIAGLCAAAHGDPNRAWPSFALAMTLFDDPAWDVVSPERPLRYWRLIEIDQPSGRALTASALRADERIVNYLKGLNYLDDRLAPMLAPIESADWLAPSSASADDAAPAPRGREALPPSQRAVVEAIVRSVRTASRGVRVPIIQILGNDESSKQQVAACAATELGLQPIRVPLAQLPGDSTQLDHLARLWQRESMLLPVVLYLDATDVEHAATTSSHTMSATQALARFVERVPGLVFVASRDTRPDIGPGMGRPCLAFEADKPTPFEQQHLWQQLVGTVSPTSSPALAAQFHLSSTAIARIAHTALMAGQPHGDGDGDSDSDSAGGDDGDSDSPTPRTGDSNTQTFHNSLWHACLVATRPQLDVLAQRIDAKATWDEFVLPAEQAALLRQIAAQVRRRSQVYDDWGFRRRMNRGLGITALFAGDSGTGKTMAAEVLANDLRLNLYRIDLAGVVSKYIGETEKNLRKLFDAAEDGGALLFFDEADALFGKRSEVKDSHDRYANIEVNYLLQRMEGYRGLAILATNQKSALDKAFMRRIRFILDFPFPGPEQRKAIWQRAFPPEVPLEGIDWRHLARLQLTGGSIHNIALNAAFCAADRDGPVSMTMVLDAARVELRKMERPIHEAEFRWKESKR